MSDAVVVAALAALPATLGLVFSYLNGRRGKQIKVKTEEIHGLVNSKMASALEEIASLKLEIVKLKEEIDNHKP